MKNIPAWAVALFTLTFVVSPAFTTFTGFDETQLPIPQIDPPIQPAGYAFSIWGLIYGWLIVSAIFGLLRRGGDAGWDRARAPLALSLAIGTPWLWVATQSAVWATILIIVMAVTAIAALLRAPKTDRWWLQAPIALYAGWLTAASCVSLGSTAAGYGIAFGSFGWAVAGILIALCVTLSVYWVRNTAPEYVMAVIWALIGIVVANMGNAIWVAALASAGIIALILAIITLYRPAYAPNPS